MNILKNISEPDDIDIQAVRSRLIDRILTVISEFSPAALALSLLRFLEHGWHPIYGLHIFVVAFLITLTLFLKKIPFNIRVFILLAIGLIMGAMGLFTFGLATAGYLILFSIALLATIFFGIRAGIIVLAIDACIIIAFGLAVCTGIKVFTFDANEYLTSATFWIMLTAIFCFFGPLTIYAIGIIYDHLNKSLAKMKESEIKYRVLFESANDAIFLMKKDRLVDCNAKALEMFGVTYEQIIGQSAFRFSPEFQPDGNVSKQKALEKINGTLQGKSQFFEWQHRRYDGSLFDVEISMAKMEIGGKPFLLALIRDITQRKVAEKDKKDMERRLQQGQKMEAIGTLAGGIAHDFNNILSSILGFSELVKYDLTEQDQEIRENIEGVIKSGLRAKELVEHILTFSRSAEGEKGPVMPSIIIKEVVKLLRATLPAAIETGFQLKDEDAAVFGDASRIHQVVMNLCVNAAHAMRPQGGRLEIRIEKKTIAENETNAYKEAVPGVYLELSVSDTGHGIREEIIDRIFDPFFTTKERGEGTGMGLSVVHGIVKDMESFLRVESVPGEGSVFYVLMPIYEGTPDEVPVESARPSRKGTGRILIVDDELDITVAAGKFLQRTGFEVTTRNRSTDALELFLREPEVFELVITDYSMPHMNGIELSRKIRAARPDIPIILCTGFSEDITQQVLDELGVHSLLMKPLILSKLSKAAINAIDGTD